MRDLSDKSMPHLQKYGTFKLIGSLALIFAGILLLFVAIAAAFPQGDRHDAPIVPASTQSDKAE